MNQAHLGETHRVENVSTELVDYNLFTTDTPLVEAVAREGGVLIWCAITRLTTS